MVSLLCNLHINLRFIYCIKGSGVMSGSKLINNILHAKISFLSTHVRISFFSP